MGLAAPQHMGSSRTRDQTCDPGTGRRILNHWATKEVLISLLTYRQYHELQAMFFLFPILTALLVLLCLVLPNFRRNPQDSCGRWAPLPHGKQL